MGYSGTVNNTKSIREMLYNANLHTKIYILLFVLFSFQIAPNDIVLALSVIVFFAANLETDIYLYMFSLPWMYVGKFSFGVTISLVNTVLLVLKIVTGKRKIRFTILEGIIFAYLLMLGALSLLLNRSFTGISICLYYFIAVYVYSTYAVDREQCNEFWEKCLFIIMISTAICIIYGFRADTGYDRWISGMGYVTQLYGTMGTSRFGLYLALSLLYPLYYVDNKITKLILSVLVAISIIETVSMTALALLIFILGYYVLTTGRMSVRKARIFIVVGLAVALVIIFWEQIGNIDALRPMYIRTNLIISQLKAGDLNTATSGRVSMSDVYVDRFESYSLFNKLFGGASLSVAESGYSHNSYLDMLNYCGIVGALLFALLQLRRIREYSKTAVKGQAILAKLLFIITGATVSIFSSQYWLMLFFM